MTTTVRKSRPAPKTGNPKTDKTLTEAVGDKLVENMAAELEARQGTVTSTDGALTVTPAANGHKTPVSPRDMTNVRVYGPNGIEGGGHFHIHKSGCADLRKAEYRALASEAWGTSSQDEYSIVLGIYEDIIAEHTPKYPSEASGVHAMADTVTFFPCLDGLLVKLADDERQPKPVRRPRGKAAVRQTGDGSAQTSAPQHEAKANEMGPELVTDKTEPEPATADAKAAKRTAKQDLARRVVNAIADAITAEQLAGSATLTGMTVAEAQRCVAQWTHHLPTGTGEDGKRWWPASLPRPDRSDWA